MKACPECNSQNVRQYRRPVAASGGDGPDLLPDLSSSFFSTAKLLPTLCLDCGLIRFYASNEAREKASKAEFWNKV